MTPAEATLIDLSTPELNSSIASQINVYYKNGKQLIANDGPMTLLSLLNFLFTGFKFCVLRKDLFKTLLSMEPNALGIFIVCNGGSAFNLPIMQHGHKIGEFDLHNGTLSRLEFFEHEINIKHLETLYLSGIGVE